MTATTIVLIIGCLTSFGVIALITVSIVTETDYIYNWSKKYF